MSNKEMIIKLLEEVPEYKMGYLLAFARGLIADEENDDKFCEEMYQTYLNDNDPEKDNVYSLEDCKKEWGIE